MHAQALRVCNLQISIAKFSGLYKVVSGADILSD